MESKIVLFLDREEPAQVPSLFREGMCPQHAGYRLGNLVSLFLPQMTPSHLSSSRHVILHLETSATEDVWVQDSRVPAPALEQPCQRLLVKSQNHSTPQSLKKSMNQVDSGLLPLKILSTCKESDLAQFANTTLSDGARKSALYYHNTCLKV